ncbi:MAG: hypothetical protein HYY67_07255 [Thaumarchaeota archaeon]|nr:hypothetical protein [Nitrososphaerota archaeon]
MCHLLSKVSFIEKLVSRIKLLNEDQLRYLIRGFLIEKFGPAVDDTHGTAEHGADIVWVVNEYADPLRKKQLVLIQIKASNITLPIWREGLCNQMCQLYYWSGSVYGVDRSTPRRFILITSGDITTEARTAIDNWNAKMPIPVEAFGIIDFADWLDKVGYPESKIDDLIQLGKPKIAAIA